MHEHASNRMIMQMDRLAVGVVGASGFTGAELLRLLASHPGLEVRVVTGDSLAGRPAAEQYPSLAAAYPGLRYERLDADRLHGLDLVFLGLPHEASMELAPQLVGRVGCVVDLSAAFRIRDASAYPQYYGFEHTQPDLLAEAVFGLPELHRDELKGSRLVATPGCHAAPMSRSMRAQG